MYYVEEVRGGVLCYKTSPEGKWYKVSLRDMTERYTNLKKENTSLRAQLANAKEMLAHRPTLGDSK